MSSNNNSNNNGGASGRGRGRPTKAKNLKENNIHKTGSRGRPPLKANLVDPDAATGSDYTLNYTPVPTGQRKKTPPPPIIFQLQAIQSQLKRPPKRGQQQVVLSSAFSENYFKNTIEEWRRRDKEANTTERLWQPRFHFVKRAGNPRLELVFVAPWVEITRSQLNKNPTTRNSETLARVKTFNNRLKDWASWILIQAINTLMPRYSRDDETGLDCPVNWKLLLHKENGIESELLELFSQTQFGPLTLLPSANLTGAKLTKPVWSYTAKSIPFKDYQHLGDNEAWGYINEIPITGVDIKSFNPGECLTNTGIDAIMYCQEAKVLEHPQDKTIIAYEPERMIQSFQMGMRGREVINQLEVQPLIDHLGEEPRSTATITSTIVVLESKFHFVMLLGHRDTKKVTIFDPTRAGGQVKDQEPLKRNSKKVAELVNKIRVFERSLELAYDEGEEWSTNFDNGEKNRVWEFEDGTSFFPIQKITDDDKNCGIWCVLFYEYKTRMIKAKNPLVLEKGPEKIRARYVKLLKGKKEAAPAVELSGSPAARPTVSPVPSEGQHQGSPEAQSLAPSPPPHHSSSGLPEVSPPSPMPAAASSKIGSTPSKNSTSSKASSVGPIKKKLKSLVISSDEDGSPQSHPRSPITKGSTSADTSSSTDSSLLSSIPKDTIKIPSHFIYSSTSSSEGENIPGTSSGSGNKKQTILKKVFGSTTPKKAAIGSTPPPESPTSVKSEQPSLNSDDEVAPPHSPQGENNITWEELEQNAAEHPDENFIFIETHMSEMGVHITKIQFVTLGFPKYLARQVVDGCGFYAEGMSFETEEKFIFFPSAVVDQIVQGNVDLPVANAILKIKAGYPLFFNHSVNKNGHDHCTIIVATFADKKISIYDPEKNNDDEVEAESVVVVLRAIRKAISTTLKEAQTLWNSDKGQRWPKKIKYISAYPGKKQVYANSGALLCAIFMLRWALPDEVEITALDFERLFEEDGELSDHTSILTRKYIMHKLMGARADGLVVVEA